MNKNIIHKKEIIESILQKELPLLYEWAVSQDFLKITTVLIYTLGFFSYSIKKASLRNLVDELLRSESIQTLKKWHDNNEVNDLIRFAQSYRASSAFMYYPSRVPSGDTVQAVKRITGYKEQSYLLAMVLNPLTHSAEHYERRQKLRLWVITHCVMRVTRYAYHGDTKMSSLARALILGPGSIADWEFVDFFLVRTIKMQAQDSFDDFNYALTQTAAVLLQEKNQSYGRKEKTFLSNIIAIANYECHPIDESNSSNSSNSSNFPHFPSIDLSLKSNAFTVQLKLHEINAGTDFSITAGFNYLPIAGISADLIEVESAEILLLDDQEPELLFQVDPSQNEAEQLLTTRSIFLHTAEEASYLPWSINQILPTEKNGLIEWLNQSLVSTDLTLALGASFCLMALQTGRTLDGVRRFKIKDALDYEWAISDDFSKIHKKTTRRQNAWQPNEQSVQLIAHFSDELIISLNRKITETLQLTANNLNFKPESLHDIWRINLQETKLEVWFNNVLPEELSRITSSKLASFLGQQVFEKTCDHNLARNMTAHPNSGLPASCGYGTWDLDVIEKCIEQPLVVERSISPKTNLLGSLLSPLEELLVKKIEQANKLLEEEHELVEFHNLISQYTIYALYAATGARYLIDPFESINHFNLEHGFVFINDKSDGAIHKGRIVALPVLAIRILQQYLKHLENLVEHLKFEHTTLAVTISKLAVERSEKMPLFFLLDNQLGWHSLNKSDLPGVPLFEWGLPKNLFRHRYTQKLYKESVPMEVIDGFMGHAERGAITYGDTSPRCRLSDIRDYDHSINTVFEVLPFKIISLSNKAAAPSLSRIQASLSLEARLFGEKSRNKKSSLTLRKNIKKAREDICSALRGRSLSEISAEETQGLVNKMLFRGGQLGHPFAAVRLEILRKQIHRHAPEHLRVIRQRLVKENNDKNTLSGTISQDYQTFKTLKTWSASLPTGRAHYSKTSASLIGAALLAIVKRIAYPRMLIDILGGDNFRLLKNNQQLYIEYNEDLEIDNPYAPVQRHEINQQIASLITFGASRKKQAQDSNTDEVKELRKILQLDNEVTHTEILQKLARLMEQVNHVDMPCMVGAMLAGRVLCTSLPMQDHLRIKEQKLLIWRHSEPLNSLTHQDNIQSSLRGQVESQDAKVLKGNAITFRKTILLELNVYTPSKSKETAKKISKICLAFEGKISNALLLLGFWTAHITERGRLDKKSKPLAINSIRTYWGTLITVFEKLAYTANLIALDSEEVTELYRDMLDYKLLRSNTSAYFGKRLVDFHRWAKNFGVVDPDWSELDLEEEVRLVRPGVLSELDYQSSLKYIQAAYDDADTRLLMSFLLLLTYRFGLRSSEASGLLSRDWCQYQELRWVLVRNNKIRKLKTESSQRAIPLLFELSSLEEKLVEQVLTRYQALAGNNKKHPVFCELENGKIKSHSQIQIFPSAIIEVIRAVTGSTDLVLHHCRHSFHNRAAAALLDIDTPLTRALNKDLNKDRIQQIVLGQNHQISRRSSMGLARLMGHSSPATGMRNYNHLLTEWADKLTPVSSKRIDITDCINTKDFIPYLAPKPMKTEISYQPVTMENTFKTLRLVAIGWAFEKAGLQLELDPSFIKKLKNTFEHANNKMRFNARGSKEKIFGNENPYALLRYINSDAWQRILSIAAETPEDVVKNASSVLPLNELHNMIGRNRQILIDSTESADLIRLALKLFKVNEEHYSVSARGNDSAIESFLQEQGFDVVPVEQASYKGTSIAVDPYEIFENEKKKSTRYEYGVLNIFRNEGALRNSNELVVALLGVGVYFHAATV